MYYQPITGVSFFVVRLHADTAQFREARRYHCARIRRSATYNFATELFYPQTDRGGSAVARHNFYTLRRDTNQKVRKGLMA